MVFSSSGFITSCSNENKCTNKIASLNVIERKCFEEQSSSRASLHNCVDYRECLCFNIYKVVWQANYCMVIFLCCKCGPWNSKWDDFSVVFCTLTIYHEVVLFLGKLPNQCYTKIFRLVLCNYLIYVFITLFQVSFLLIPLQCERLLMLCTTIPLETQLKSNEWKDQL